MQPEFFLFDLDNTLYPRHCGLFDEVDRRINLYLHEMVKIPAPEVDRRRRAYLDAHGTTLNGLIAHHEIDPQHYLAYVHDVPLADYLRPDPAQRRLLESLPGRKYIFSNASRAHCGRVLEQLALETVFEAVFDLDYFALRPKPEPAIYDELLNAIDGRAERGVMVDDLPVNLEPAAALGLQTFYYNPSSKRPELISGPSRHISCLSQLADYFPV